MASIEDFVGELYEGKREVSVPKDQVTELSPGWYTSKYNMPHRGSSGSWRFGRLHAHDMGDYYSVHLDRVDPQAHGIIHLIADAPLMLFLWAGFKGAILAAREDKSEWLAKERNLLPTFLVGLTLLIVGLLVVLEQSIAIRLIIISSNVGLLMVGISFYWQGIRTRDEDGYWLNLVAGMIVIALAVIIYFYPNFALVLLIFALVVWTLGSGIFLVFARGEKLLFDEESLVPLVMGILSLALGLLMVLSPQQSLSVVLTLAGLLLVFIGLMEIVSAVLIVRAVRRSRRTAGP